MKSRLTFALMLIAVLVLPLTVAAGTEALEKRQFRNRTSSGSTMERDLSLAITTGESGTSFRYDTTYGYTEEPYLADTAHINRPHGLFVDDSDNMYVIEEQGCRVLRYDSSGSNTLALGEAGVCYTADGVFCVPQDVALDSSGALWVADGNRVVQYDTTGSFLQQFPEDEPWSAGSDNTRFNQVHGIAFDSSGRMYVSDGDNHRIQVFDLSGGSPVYSTTIGTAGTAGSGPNQFNLPYRIALDSSDRLYIVDSGNDRVQQCTFGTSWSCATLDSGLNDPQGIAVDSSDNAYIADTRNRRIRKCSSGGVCSDLVTDAYGFYDVAVDSTGNVYGAAPYEDIVVQYDSGGSWVGTYLGTEFVPYLTDSFHYSQPRIAIDSSNNLIIVEESGQRVLKRNPSGMPLWAVGVPGVDAYDNAHFNYPHGAAVDSSDRIYVADGWANRVQIYDRDGAYLATLGTGWGTGEYEFKWAAGIAVGGDGYIYVSDGENHRVQVYDSSRAYVTTLGETGVCGSDNDHFCYPVGIAVDSAGNLYVADSGNARVQKFNNSLQWQMTLGTTQSWGVDFDRFGSPEDIAVDGQGRIYVADIWNNRVQVFDADGEYLTTIGGAWGAGNSQFRAVSSVAVDSVGNVYLSDLQNGRIQRFAPGVPGWQQANVNGFGERWNRGIGALETFGSQLYAATYNQDSGTRVWRTADGDTWTAASEFGFSGAYANTNYWTLDLAVFDSQLYAGVRGDVGQIWRTSDGTTWSPIQEAGFGNTNNSAVSAFAVFDGLLYAATDNGEDGLEIWRSSTGDASSWSQVVSGGFNGALNNRRVCGFAGYDGYLYASVENTTDGVEIWRTNDGVSWAQANTSGFGDADNGETGGIVAFDGYLYAGTRNDTTGAQLWRSGDGAAWTQVVGNGFGNADNLKLESLVAFDGDLYAVAGNDVTGLTVWRSADGLTWMQINPDGFGDSNNDATLWSQATAAFEDSLYIGTWNWEGNGGEVWEMVRQGGFARKYTTADGLANDEVTAVAIDSTGRKWLGTWGGGISMFDDGDWTTHTTANGLGVDDILAVAIDGDGHTWAGTWGGGVNEYDGSAWTVHLPGTGIRSVAVDGSNRKWIGGWNLYVVDGGTWTTYTPADGMAGPWVDAIAFDGTGTAWLSNDGGVSRFDGTTWTTYTTSDGLASDDVRAIAVDQAGNVWFGTWNGLTKFDGATWTTYSAANGLPSNHITAIAVDEAGNLWTGTYDAGIVRYDGTAWTNYSVVDGLVDNSVNALAIDEKGHVWTGTDGGVSELIPDAVPLWTSGLQDDALTYVDPQGYTTTVQLPGTAITASTRLVYIPQETVTDLDGLQFAGHAFELEAYRGGVLQHGLTFKTPVTVTIRYADEDVSGLDESGLELRYWNGSLWSTDGIVVQERDAASNRLVVTVAHLSEFAMVTHGHKLYLPLVLQIAR